MKKISGILMVLALASVLVTGCKGKTPAPQAGKVLAEVNGAKITETDFSAELEGKPDFYKQYAQSADGKKQILDRLVERKLILATADKEGLSNSPEVEAKIQAYRERVILDKLKEKVLASQFQVTDDDVKDYFNAHPEMYNRPEAARVKEIVVADAKTGDQVYREAKASPAKFDELARKYSIDTESKNRGGDKGFVNKGDFPPELDAKAFALKEQEISPPVSSGGKFYILQVVQKRPAEQKELSQVADQIKRRLEIEKKQDQWKTYLDNLKKGAQITYTK